MSDNMLIALGEATANMYLCQKDLRPSEKLNSLRSILSLQFILDALLIYIIISC